MVKLPEPIDVRTARTWSARRRLEFIEFRLFWQGTVNRADLTEKFGTSPQQATIDLGDYQRLAPGNCVYDRIQKTYVAGRPFKPLFEGCRPEVYLNELRTLGEGIVTKYDAWLGVVPAFEGFRFPAPRIVPAVLRAVLRGIHQGRAVLVFYQSSRRPEPDFRWITPHALFEFGARWFVRAFCHRHGDFRDFQLGRMIKVRNGREHAVSPKLDREWIETINLELGISPHVPMKARGAIELDHGLGNGRAQFSARVALAQRVMQGLSLDVDSPSAPKSSCGIDILNRGAVEAMGAALRMNSAEAVQRAKIERLDVGRSAKPSSAMRDCT